MAGNCSSTEHGLHECPYARASCDGTDGLVREAITMTGAAFSQSGEHGEQRFAQPCTERIIHDPEAIGVKPGQVHPRRLHCQTKEILMLRWVVVLALSSMVLAQEPKPLAPTPAVGPKEPTVVLEGRVVDLRGEPVPLAKLTVTSDSGAEVVIARGMSDGEGFFRIGRVPKRDWWRVRAEAEGRCSGTDSTMGTPSPLRIQVHDCATVKGTLLDRAGKPVPAAVVRGRIEGRVLWGSYADGTTDAEGHFELRGVPLGPVRFAAVVPGEGLAQLQATVSGNSEIRLATDASPTTTLRITLKGLPDERPADLSVSLLPYHDGSLLMFPPPWDKPCFDKDGVLELLQVPTHQYVVRPTGKGVVFQPNQISVKEDQGPHTLEFRCSMVGTKELSCPARLVDDEGRPLAGVPLVLRRSNGGVSAEATTDEAGKITFSSPLAAGTKVIVYSTDPKWVLDQTKDERSSGSWDTRFRVDHECVLDPTTTLELRAIPACSVTGHLMLPDQRPAAFLDVELEEAQPSRSPRWMPFAYATTDRDGNFRFQGRHHLDHEVRVKVECAEGFAVSEPFVMAQQGSHLVVPDLPLSPPACIEGVVRDSEQRPAPGIRVWLRDWDFGANGQRSGSVVEVITDRLGRYRFVGVPPGGAWLQLLATPGERFETGRAKEPFEVEPGKTYTEDLQLPAK
jgi:hypothetical protein